MSLVTPVAQMQKSLIYVQRRHRHHRADPSRQWGDTTIMTEEARRIKEIVQDTIREQFASGRAALRSNLGLPAQGLTTTRDRASEENLLDIGANSSRRVITKKMCPQLHRWEIQYLGLVLDLRYLSNLSVRLYRHQRLARTGLLLLRGSQRSLRASLAETLKMPTFGCLWCVTT